MSAAATVLFAFNGRNLLAQRRAAQHSTRLIRYVATNTRDGVRAVITASIQDGIHPERAEKMILGLIGLDTRSAMAVYSYRLRLDAQGIPEGRAQVLQDRYADKKLRERAENIGRTETMQALNDGSEEAAQQAQEAGLLDEPVKEVQVTDDEKTCPVCEEMDGQTVPLGQRFSRSGPPFHNLCRCTFAVVEGRRVVVRG